MTTVELGNFFSKNVLLFLIQNISDQVDHVFEQ